MKRISIVLIVFVLMAISFVAVGGMILYVTGTVTSVNELEALFTRTEQPVAFIEDPVGGTTLLEQQKSELASELSRTRKKIEGLRILSEILSASSGDAQARKEAQERAKQWFSETDPRTTAEILTTLEDDTVTGLLSDVDDARVTEILDAMDAPTRTRLIGAMKKK